MESWMWIVLIGAIVLWVIFRGAGDSRGRGDGGDGTFGVGDSSDDGGDGE